MIFHLTISYTYLPYYVNIYCITWNDYAVEKYYACLSTIVTASGRRGMALTDDDLRTIIRGFKEIQHVPEDVWEQLQLAITAVYTTWFAEKHLQYREEVLNLSPDLGVAVVVQAMVFGGSGSCFTRSPTTGEDKVIGEYWPTSGLRQTLDEMAEVNFLILSHTTR
jgi:hypothetical protein